MSTVRIQCTDSSCARNFIPSKINIARWLYCTPTVTKIQDCSLGKTGDSEQSNRIHFVFFFVFEFGTYVIPANIHVETKLFKTPTVRVLNIT